MTQLITGVVPGSGPMSTTSWIYGISAGDWEVRAEVVGPERARAANLAQLEAVAWSWRRRSLILAPTLAKTRWALTAPLAATPGVVRGSFAAAVAIALTGAILVQPFFLAHHGVPVGTAIAVSVIAMILGLVGAKAWYMALRGPSIATLRER